MSGVNVPTSLCIPPTRNVSQHIPPAEGSALPTCEDGVLRQLLTHADSVSNWISAEIVICDSVKVRGDLNSWKQEGQREKKQKQAITATASALTSHLDVSHRLYPLCAFCRFSSLMVEWFIKKVGTRTHGS